MDKKQMVIIAIVVILILVNIIFLGASFYLYTQSQSTIYDNEPSKGSLPEFDHEQFFVENKDGESLDIIYVENTSSDNVIIYFHGNAGRTFPIMDDMSEYASVVSIAYPGFSQSEGVPNSANTEEATEIIYNYTINELGYSSDQILFYGHSLGGALAVHANTLYGDSVKATVLVNTFDSIRSMCEDDYSILCWPLNNIHNSVQKSSDMKGTVRQYHTPDDERVPYDKGRNLSISLEKNVSDFIFKNIEGKHSEFEIEDTLELILIN